MSGHPLSTQRFVSAAEAVPNEADDVYGPASHGSDSNYYDTFSPFQFSSPAHEGGWRPEHTALLYGPHESQHPLACVPTAGQLEPPRQVQRLNLSHIVNRTSPAGISATQNRPLNAPEVHTCEFSRITQRLAHLGPEQQCLEGKQRLQQQRLEHQRLEIQLLEEHLAYLRLEYHSLGQEICHRQQYLERQGLEQQRLEQQGLEQGLEQAPRPLPVNGQPPNPQFPGAHESNGTIDENHHSLHRRIDSPTVLQGGLSEGVELITNLPRPTDIELEAFQTFITSSNPHLLPGTQPESSDPRPLPTRPHREWTLTDKLIFAPLIETFALDFKAIARFMGTKTKSQASRPSFFYGSPRS